MQDNEAKNICTNNNKKKKEDLRVSKSRTITINAKGLNCQILQQQALDKARKVNKHSTCPVSKQLRCLQSKTTKRKVQRSQNKAKSSLKDSGDSSENESTSVESATNDSSSNHCSSSEDSSSNDSSSDENETQDSDILIMSNNPKGSKNSPERSLSVESPNDHKNRTRLISKRAHSQNNKRKSNRYYKQQNRSNSKQKKRVRIWLFRDPRECQLERHRNESTLPMHETTTCTAKCSGCGNKCEKGKKVMKCQIKSHTVWCHKCLPAVLKGRRKTTVSRVMTDDESDEEESEREYEPPKKKQRMNQKKVGRRNRRKYAKN